MAEKKLQSKTFKRILFCTDLSKNADFAFDFAVDVVCHRSGCEFYILHVIPESESQFWKTYIYEVEDVDFKAKHDLDERMKTLYLERAPEGMNIHIEYKIGKDYQEILKFANEKQIDLIVIGRQGHSSISKPFFGNVAEKIVRKARCAVLVVPLDLEKRFRIDNVSI